MRNGGVSYPCLTKRLSKYRSIMNSILPKSQLGAHAFSMKHIPYAYFTIKFKCFKNTSQQCCNIFTPGKPTMIPIIKPTTPTRSTPALK